MAALPLRNPTTLLPYSLWILSAIEARKEEKKKENFSFDTQLFLSDWCNFCRSERKTFESKRRGGKKGSSFVIYNGEVPRKLLAILSFYENFLKQTLFGRGLKYLHGSFKDQEEVDEKRTLIENGFLDDWIWFVDELQFR